MGHGSRGVVAAGNVVVVGAGASGVLSAAALLRARRSTVLLERDAAWSTGAAYATQDPSHLLNVPAGKLSADSRRPGDFVDWAAASRRGVSAHSFLPRRVFGEYLRHSLDGAERGARPVPLSRVSADVIRIDAGCASRRDRGPVRVELRGGQTLLAAHVVLALGNPPSRALARDVDNVIEDPWSVCSSDLIDTGDTVVIVGTGLTAIDVALTFARRGHRGSIRMISRHGLLPRQHHLRSSGSLLASDACTARTAREAVAWFRAAIEASDGDWRAVVDAMRPQTNEIWRALPEAERARLLRHAGRRWEVHRHRIAPEVGRAVEQLVGTGRLKVLTGSVTRVERGGRDACRVAVRDAAGVPRDLEARWVINCTGPNFDLRESASPLIQSMFRSGTARPGPLGHGLDATPDGALVDRAGRGSSLVSVVGPLRRGAEWETTAIPEIRAQAEALARRVAPARRVRRSADVLRRAPIEAAPHSSFERTPALRAIEVA